MNSHERMEQVLKDQPQIGRWSLSRLAGVTENVARRFLNLNRHPGIIVDDKKITSEPPDLFKDLSPKEKKLVLDGLKHYPVGTKSFPWAKESIKFAFFTDPHWGHLRSDPAHWQKVCDLITKEKCEFAICGGDITEGMSGRPGHMYELNAIGSTAQVNLAISRLRMLPCACYGINGNHDLWGFKHTGFDPSATIADMIPTYNHMGMHEFDLKVGNLLIKTWHGEDGSTYALSYRLQKFVEALSGGEKPHILLAGHDHKAGMFPFRNVICYAGGTLEGQTMWMRNKKIAAMLGFWIIEAWQNDAGLERVREMWVPFYD